MKSHQYTMDIKTADETLQNVFAACDRKPNTIPFDQLLKEHPKGRPAALCMWISILFLTATLLTPFCFRNHMFRLSRLQDVSQHITIEEHHMEDDCFTIRLSGDNIDYENISIIDEDGTVTSPDLTDSSKETVCICHPSGTLTIYIPDQDGHTLTAVLSVDKED